MTISAPRFATRLVGALALAATLFTISDAAAATSRIKDIVEVEGIRDNILIGYGLVVGLNGTGDGLRNAPFTRQSLASMLERLGVNTRDANINTKNVAAVMVTSDLPPFARQGVRIDVSISALGDAKSLQGGVLLVTPLLGADGEVYAVSQGPIAVGGFAAGGDAATIVKGVPTVGRIANGAIVEREVGFDLASLSQVHLSLRNPDLTTARRIAQTINGHLGTPAATALDPATVRMDVARSGVRSTVDLITDVEQLMIETDQPARVVIDEGAGIIVMGADVRVDEVAIAQGNLTVRVTETLQVSQPNAFSENGETVVVPRTDVQVDEGEDRQLAVLNRGVSLQELVDGLNRLGVGPRDLISILQTIKSAGALQAEIVVQ
ncbi:MAG: flagellar basal body P-ring protein FlgI [Alphaproteobacteria bacterium]